MKHRQVKLLQGAENIRIEPFRKDNTTILFTCPQHPKTICLHIISERWEIESIDQNIVNLVNHDTVIPYQTTDNKPLILD